MAEFKLGRLRFVWQGAWTTGTDYVKDDIVRYGGSSFVCVAAHTAAADFYTNFDVGAWELMTSGLSWRTDPWTEGTWYAEGDVVRNGGKIYIAINGHTAGADFNTDFDNAQWQLLVDGIQWKTSPWTANGTLYKEGDLVRHGGRVYVCINGHDSSAGFEADFNAANWQLFADGSQWVNSWTASQLYKVGDVTRVSGKTYICVNEHTANATQRGGFYSDISNWNLYADGTQYQGAWDTNAYYWIGDIVRHGAKSYICVSGHEADADFYVDFDLARWELHNDGQQWVGEWQGVHWYKEGDIVRYGSRSYICVNGHTSNADFYVDLDTTQWNLLNDGQEWMSNWTPNTWYKERDIVVHGGRTYICLNGHQSDVDLELGFDTDLAADEWELFTDGIQWKNTWVASTYYKLNDVARYGAKSYICVTAHIADADFYTDVDAGSWELITDGQQWKTAAWTEETLYKEGDLVRYGGRVYICVNGHTATAITNRFDTDFDAGNWQLFSDGQQWKTSPWTASAYYKTGDIVRYGGKTYIAVDDHQADASQNGGFYINLAANKWQLFSDGTQWVGDWLTSTYYKLGDIARYDGNIYVCVEGHTSAGTEALGLELDLQGTPKWDVYSEGFKYKGNWDTTTKYNINDVVKFGGSLYICISYHTSASSFAEANWNVLIGGLEFEDTWNVNVEYQLGDIVTYGGYSYVATRRNTGSIPSTHPSDWELLTTGFKVQGDWSNTATYKVGDVIRYGGSSYVATTDHIANSKPANPDGSTADGWEITAAGINWRSGWLENIDYRVGDAVRWVSNSYICKIDHNSAAANSQPDQDTYGLYWDSLVEGAEGNALTRRGDLVTRNAIRNTRLPRGIPGQVLQTQGYDVVWDYYNQVDKVYYVKVDGIDGPEDYSEDGRGLTLETAFASIKYATDYILADEATRAPATIFVKTGAYYEVLPIIIPANVAIVGDELRSTRVLPAAGYEAFDMFYMRDGSGLRNMTLRGLSGTLGAENQYLTKRPNAGCYTSLDPGTGPGDESVWIIYRSPYVQNVSNFGDGCVGLKVDGALHNGGNRTIVCNDYTQVLNDGIGIWATNQGRVENVSVFCYYNHIGYLAENGGIIRSTNGNSSYGDYGIVAEGVDPSEVSRIATVNNQRLEAQIANTITDGDGVIAIEYSNAGENYTAGGTTYSFFGSGVANSIVVNTPVVRNGAVKEVRVLDAGESWTGVLNNAQSGNSLQVRISASDVAVNNSYNGCRIYIIDGVGTGQYGYITKYTSGTQIAMVAKESFKTLTATATETTNDRITVSSSSTLTLNQPVVFTGTVGSSGITADLVYYVLDKPTSTTFRITDTSGGVTPVNLGVASGLSLTVHAAGWESIHGAAIQPTLDSTSRYSIEPRVIFSTGEGANVTGAISKGVDAIAFTGGSNSAGAYYQAAPNVIISGSESDATGATATASITGSVEKVEVRSGGSGYTGTPNVQFIGGNPSVAATGVANVINTISEVVVTNRGSGYSNTPMVQISGTGYNNDGYVTANMTKIVGEIEVSNGGANYTSPPTVTFAGGQGTGAEAVAILSAEVTGFTLIEGGNGYTTDNTVVTITPVAGDTTGAGATAHAVIDNGALGGPGVITEIVIDDHGSGYQEAPVVTITDDRGNGYGVDAAASALINGIVASVVVTNGGRDFRTAPQVQFSSGSAYATATISGAVDTLSIISGGSGFSGPVTLNIIPASDFVYDETKCSRDVGLMVSSVTSDMVFGSNYQATKAGLAYLRSYSAVVLESQKTETVAAIRKARSLAIAQTSDAAAKLRIGIGFNIIKDIVDNGLSSVPTLSLPAPANTDQGIIDGTAVLQANRSFLRAEIVAWINNEIADGPGSSGNAMWNGFTYDSAVCSRDVGYLIDAMSFDLLYGGNTQSKDVALSYWRNSTAFAETTQAVAAYTYLKSIIDEVIQNTSISKTTGNLENQNVSLDPGSSTAATTVQGLLDIINDIVTDGSTSSPTVNPTYNNGSIDAGIKTTVDAAISSIQNDVISWINATYVGAGATATAGTDHVISSVTITGGSGYTSAPTISISGGNGTGALARAILSASVNQITIDAPGKNYVTTPTVAFSGGHNFKSLVAGEAYYRNASAEVAIGPFQLTQTLAAIDYIKVLAKAIATNTQPVASYQSVVSRTGSSTAPAGAYDQTSFWVDVVEAVAQNGGVLSNAATLLSYNRAFIAAEAVAYATANINNSYFTTAELRKRVGLIVDALYDDFTAGTVEHTLAIGEKYGTLISSHVPETLDVLTFINAVAQKVITNSTVTAINIEAVVQVFQPLLITETVAPTAVLNNINLIKQLASLGAVTGDSANSTYTGLLLSNINWIKAEVIEYVKSNFTNFTYDQSKCERDLGLILNAIGMDISLGTNYNSVTAGLAYQRANAAEVKANQNATTIAAIKFARDRVLALNDVNASITAINRATTGFDEIVDIIRFGTGSANSLSFPTPTGANQDLVDAKNQLQANRTFLRAEVIAWIAVNYPDVAATYNSTACSRDVGYIVDALSYDILYGGNTATRIAAQAYFVGATSQLGAGEATATSAAYNHLASVIGQVVQGTTVSKTSGNTETQDTSSGNATGAEATTLNNLVQIIEDVITLGNTSSLPAATNPSITWALSALQLATTAVSSNSSSITTSTINYINSSNAGDFSYNQELCARDVGLLVDAIAHDVRYSQDARAKATASTINVLSGITILSGGTGYGAGTTVSFTGDVGTGLTPVATPVITSGVITGFNITQPGKGYTVAPTVSVNADTGTGAFARAYILGGLVQEFRITKPGSGYTAAPYISLVDPQNVAEGSFQVRIGNGVLDQPTFTSRGTGYLAAISTVTGDGFSDIYQTGEYVFVENLTNIPTPGANVQFDGNTQFYKLVTIRDIVGPTGLLGGRNLILANKEFVKAQIISYINATYPNLVYNQTLCARDVGYILDAVASDVFGDTEKGIESGKRYYSSASAILSITDGGTAATAQKTATIAALDKIEDYLIDIVQNIDIVRNQLSQLQVKEPLITDGEDTIVPLQTTIALIKNIINNGEELLGVADLLLDNKEYVKAETIAFINTTYADFAYNEELCSRDVGLIVDAVAYDIFGGLARSSEAGLRYYANASSLIAITEQKTETVAAVQHISEILQAVANNEDPAVVYQNTVARIPSPTVEVAPATLIKIGSCISRIVSVINSGSGVLPAGRYSARLQLSPKLDVTTVPEHNTSITIRSKYSQVRLTGHDFLNVGTGNKASTNYPGIPVLQPAQENEVSEAGGGRCFYSSTDQDGNFRVGELFKVEQSTGIASLNADAFNLSGLNELSLGGVVLGGTGAVIREFSTDGTFFANSDNIVPTQKAIRTFIQSQLGSGGGNLTVNAVTAGDVQITANTISVTAEPLEITTPVGGVQLMSNIASTNTTTGSLVVAGGVGMGGTLNVGGNAAISGNLTVTGDITVNGDNSTFNVGTLAIEDINVTIAKSAASAAAANGAGITVSGPTTPATMTYASADDTWNFNKILKAPSIQATIIGSSTRASALFTTLGANSQVTFDAGTASTNTTTGTVVVTGGVGVSGALNVGGAAAVVGLNSGTGTVTLSPTNNSVTISPSGTGTVTMAPATAGNINNMNIGASTRGSGAFTSLAANSTATFTGVIVADTAANNQSHTTTGAGTITISSGTTGTINNMSIGATTRSTGAFTTLAANSAVTMTASTTSTNTTTGTLVVTGGVGVSENLNVGGNTVITGNLTVNGTTTTINSTTVTVDDILVELGSVASPTDVTANGGGIVLKGATDKSITWSSTGWTSSEDFNLASGKQFEINGTAVLTATQVFGKTIGGTAAGDIVNIDSSQTLTNKTLTLPTIGGTGAKFNGSTSGTTTLVANATAGTTTITMPATTGIVALEGNTHYIGTTAVTLNRASANLGLTGISSVSFPGSSSGTAILQATAAAGTPTINLPTASGTLALVGNTFYVGTTSIANNRASASQTLTGVSIDGNAGTASAVAWSGVSGKPTRGDWSTVGSITNVVGMLSWKHYGNSHVIFDASAGTDPSGAAISNTDPANDWSSTYPTLMGYNGSTTYGVRVARAKTSESCSGNAATASNTSSISSAVGSSYTWTGTQNFRGDNNSGYNGQAGFLVAYGNSGGTNAATMSFHRPGAYAINMGLDTDNVFRIGGWSDGSNTYRSQLDSSGNLTIRGTLTEQSSIALKENVSPITNALAAIMELVGVTYDRKDGSRTNEAGLIAEEVAEVLPNLATYDKDGNAEGVQYTKLTAYLIEAIKALKAEIDELKGNK